MVAVVLEPWQAILGGLAAAGLAVPLSMRLFTGSWLVLRPPREPRPWARWLGSLLVSWLVYYYVPLLLGPRVEGRPDMVDLWGPWLGVYLALAFAFLIAVGHAALKSMARLDWCSLCERG